MRSFQFFLVGNHSSMPMPGEVEGAPAVPGLPGPTSSLTRQTSLMATGGGGVAGVPDSARASPCLNSFVNSTETLCWCLKTACNAGGVARCQVAMEMPVAIPIVIVIVVARVGLRADARTGQRHRQHVGERSGAACSNSFLRHVCLLRDRCDRARCGSGSNDRRTPKRVVFQIRSRNVRNRPTRTPNMQYLAHDSTQSELSYGCLRGVGTRIQG